MHLYAYAEEILMHSGDISYAIFTAAIFFAFNAARQQQQQQLKKSEIKIERGIIIKRKFIYFSLYIDNFTSSNNVDTLKLFCLFFLCVMVWYFIKDVYSSVGYLKLKHQIFDGDERSLLLWNLYCLIRDEISYMIRHLSSLLRAL